MDCDKCPELVKPYAITLCALSAAGIIALTAESDLVIALAAAVDAEPSDVIKIIPAISVVVGNGVDAVILTICRLLGCS